MRHTVTKIWRGLAGESASTNMGQKACWMARHCFEALTIHGQTVFANQSTWVYKLVVAQRPVSHVSQTYYEWCYISRTCCLKALVNLSLQGHVSTTIKAIDIHLQITLFIFRWYEDLFSKEYMIGSLVILLLMLDKNFFGLVCICSRIIFFIR